MKSNVWLRLVSTNLREMHPCSQFNILVVLKANRLQ